MPDSEMMEFPIATKDHGALEIEWEESAKTWKDCLRIYHSVVATKVAAKPTWLTEGDRGRGVPPHAQSAQEP
jgi:hypothetical protein